MLKNESGKTRILMFANHYPVAGFKGGSDLHPIQDMKFFLAHDCSFEIVTSMAGYWLYSQEGVKEGPNVHFHVLRTPGAERIGLTLEYLMRTLLAIFYSLTIEVRTFVVVKSNSDWGLFDAIPAAIVKLRNRHVVWVAVCWHLIDPPFERKGREGFSVTNVASFLSQRLMLLLINLFGNLVFAETKIVTNSLGAFGITPEKAKIARGAMDSDFVRKISEQIKLYDGCYLGRIHPEKGIFDLVKIWKLVCQKIGDKKLLVMGSATPQWINAFEEAIKSEDLMKNVLFIGAVSEEEKYEHLKACKVFLHTSFEDGLPVTVCEAMACGLPVVAYELPTYHDGWMSLPYLKIPVGNKELFANAVIELLSNEQMMKKYASNQEKALEFDYQNRAKSMFTEIIKKRSYLRKS
jgi:glycosyltransferase involved in cell wall biosynthesis